MAIGRTARAVGLQGSVLGLSQGMVQQQPAGHAMLAHGGLLVCPSRPCDGHWCAGGGADEGMLSRGAVQVAEVLEMAPIRVYEVATFYTMFNRSKIGKYHVMVCGTTPCRLNGSQKVEKAIRDHLGILVGQTTPDGMFTLGEMECMGACVNAPMICIADYTKGVEGFSYNYYEDLTTGDAVGILESLKKGQPPKVGSQHRSKAEPAGSVQNDKWVAGKLTERTTLTGEAPGPRCRDLAAAKKEFEDAQAAAAAAAK
mmetsp:Transcript_35572/g.92409  ORF Transcript_35572/g.92409 Transcript_35572/m.92409 type:complete len:256 (-) Transcript_35572:97-864(-)